MGKMMDFTWIWESSCVDFCKMIVFFMFDLWFRFWSFNLVQWWLSIWPIEIALHKVILLITIYRICHCRMLCILIILASKKKQKSLKSPITTISLEFLVWFVKRLKKYELSWKWYLLILYHKYELRIVKMH